MAARVEAAIRLAVVIPAYRAAKTVTAVVSQAQHAAPAAWIVVVDDGSDDGTVSAASAAGVEVVTLDGNGGKGAALAAGIEHVASRGASVIVTMDADGQHDPAELLKVATPVIEGRADLVLGARSRTPAMPLGRRFNNWLSATLVSRAAGYQVADAQTGFRAFTKQVAERVRPVQRHYDYELAFLLGALAAGFRIGSVPVTTIYDGAPSHFRTVTDTWRLARVFARHGGRILRGGP